MSDTIDYAAEYNNSARVANAEALINQYILDAAIYREAREKKSDLDLSYGPGDRNKLDIFWPKVKKDCPMVMFIHGGYWQRLDRSSFSHMAKGLNAKGFAVAMPSYTLCPDTTIDGIINEIRRACVMLYQTYQRPLTVIGHSAGGHLAACMMATNWGEIHSDLPDDLVQAGMGISGLYELAPLISTPINDALGLNEETALASSPVDWVPDGLHRFDAWVGADESNEYHRQAREFSERWSMMGTPSQYVSVPEANHFTIVDQLTQSSSNMVQRIAEIALMPVDDPEIPEPSKRGLAAARKRFREEDDQAVKDFAAMQAESTRGQDGSDDQPENDAQPDEQETAFSEESEGADDIGDAYRLTT